MKKQGKADNFNFTERQMKAMETLEENEHKDYLYRLDELDKLFYTERDMDKLEDAVGTLRHEMADEITKARKKLRELDRLYASVDINSLIDTMEARLERRKTSLTENKPVQYIVIRRDTENGYGKDKILVELREREQGEFEQDRHISYLGWHWLDDKKYIPNTIKDWVNKCENSEEIKLLRIEKALYMETYEELFETVEVMD